jgi:hypothetical protein
MNVQHSLDDDPDVPENEYEVITCLACTKLHLINRKTGQILGHHGKRCWSSAFVRPEDEARPRGEVAPNQKAARRRLLNSNSLVVDHAAINAGFDFRR